MKGMNLLIGIFFLLVFLPTPLLLASDDREENEEREEIEEREEESERVWDDEVKRWLTQEEIGHIEVYLTEEEAARLMFPDSEHIRKEILQLAPEQKALIISYIGWEFPEDSFEVFIGETHGKTDGYAIIQNTIGKYRPITYMVGVNMKGKVTNFEVLVYRESRGEEIIRKRFNYQYQGKTIDDPIRTNKDIINITGATMSVRSASAGVKRVLVLINEFYLKPLGLGSHSMTKEKNKNGLIESILGL